MSAQRPAQDLLRPFRLERSRIKGRLVRLGPTIDRVLEAHAYPAPVGRLLGELLVLAGGLAGGLKFDGRFSLQIRAEGAVRLMVADCTNEGRMRGYASFDADRVAAVAEDDPGGLLGSGLLAVTVDQASSGGETYQGIVELDGRSLADSMRRYFRSSEQVPTGIRVALDRDGATGAWRGGAIILQALPPANEVEREAHEEEWHEAMVLLGSATDGELIDPGLEPDTLLYRLFHEPGVRVFEPLALAHGCSCDAERVEQVLLTFGDDEVEEMRLPDGAIEVTCQFCARLYRYDRAPLAALLGRRRH